MKIELVLIFKTMNILITIARELNKKWMIQKELKKLSRR